MWNEYLLSNSNIVYEMQSFLESFVLNFLYKTDFNGTWNLLLRLTILTYIYIDIEPCAWMHAKTDIQINVFRIQTQLGGPNQNSLCKIR